MRMACPLGEGRGDAQPSFPKRFGGYCSAVGLGDRPHYRQAEPGAFL